MKPKNIQKITNAVLFNMGGFPVRQALPFDDTAQIGPFLLLHHAKIQVPANVNVLHSGVGPHPHRGFAPVTFIFEGGVHHRDSRGNSHIVYAGGTQWMNAGRGIIHSERPPANIHELGGVQELIQLWVNIPSAHKMDEPTYFPLTANDTPTIVSNDQKTTIQVVAGSLDGTIGKAPTFTELNAFTIEMKEGGSYQFTIPTNHDTFLYVLGGQVTINQQTNLQAHQLAYFEKSENGISIHATSNSRMLLCSGLPINEPIVAHGPFVMNSESEIMEAMRDYQMGKMGVLIEE